MTDKLLVTIIGGLVLWMIKELIVHQVKKRRLKAAILSEISVLAASVKETKQFLEGAFSTTLKKGEKVEYSADYTPEEFDVYNVHAPTLTSYLSMDELERVIKFYRGVKEFEVLCVGFFRDLNEWKKQNHQLSEEDVQYLAKKKARIISIATILDRKEIGSLKDLPNDYRGQLTPETIVR